MKYQLSICALLLTSLVPVSAQMMSSHAPALKQDAQPQDEATMSTVQVKASGKPIAKVNGMVLTDSDLVREMYVIFPYARQHNGFPKSLEKEIRTGAKDMLIFEELVYQEALRRKMTISAAKLNRAEADLRQHYGPQGFQQYVQTEFGGSQSAMRDAVKRSLLIEALLKADVHDKAKISDVELRAYYDKNPDKFSHPETFTIQTISIIPPRNASPAVKKEAQKHAQDAVKEAKATKSYREFGLLAEKMSDDDWHVNMGDRKAVARAELPPPVVDAALKMKIGDVSDLIQLGDNYTLFRLNAHTPAGKDSFASVKEQLRTELEKEKYLELRAGLNQRLRQNAKIEQL